MQEANDVVSVTVQSCAKAHESVLIATYPKTSEVVFEVEQHTWSQHTPAERRREHCIPQVLPCSDNVSSGKAARGKRSPLSSKDKTAEVAGQA